jgi:apolipoprotein N-acyltransferase
LIKKIIGSGLTALFFLLGFEPFGISFFPILCLMFLFYYAKENTPKETAGFFYLFGVFVFAGGLYWLYISIHSVSGAPPWLAITLICLLSLVMAIYYLITGYFISLAFRKFKFDVLVLTFISPSIWALLELLRAYAITGFPWFTLGYSQVTNFLVAWAPIGGVFMVSFFSALIAGFLLLIVMKKKPYLAISCLLVICFASLYLRSIEWTEPMGDEHSVALVQGGIAQDKKWLSSEFVKTLELYRNTLSSMKNTDLVIWPEVSIPAFASNVQPYLGELETILEEENIGLLLLGINTRGKNGEIYNSVISLGNDEVIYNKRHLVPFGEYFPVPNSIRTWLKEMRLPSNDISKGAKTQRMPRINQMYLSISICYEDIFGSEVIDYQPAANVLVNATNNAWFGRSIASAQHFQMSRMRAIETGRYLLRSTNTGITAIVKPNGEVQQQLNPYEYSILRGVFIPMGGSTPYSNFGDQLCLILVIMIMTSGVFIGILRLKNKND